MTYIGWSSGIFRGYYRKLLVERVATGCPCPEGLRWNGISATPSLLHGTFVGKTAGT